MHSSIIGHLGSQHFTIVSMLVIFYLLSARSIFLPSLPDSVPQKAALSQTIFSGFSCRLASVRLTSGWYQKQVGEWKMEKGWGISSHLFCCCGPLRLRKAAPTALLIWSLPLIPSVLAVVTASYCCKRLSTFTSNCFPSPSPKPNPKLM